MSPGLLCSALVATAIGLVGLRALWPDAVPLRPYGWLVLFIGAGLGLGITAVGLFGWLVAAGVPGRRLAGVELVVLAALAALLARRRWAGGATSDDRFTVEGSSRPRSRIIVPAFVATLLCAVAAFIGLSASHPHGGWDAWMNWNLRARLLFRGGPQWRTAFSPLLEWSHPDYPLLVQGSVVRAWVYGGGETLAGPAVIAFLFTFATLGLVTTAVAVFRGRTQAMLAGLVLLGTPFFIFHGTSQYGDVPVGYFFLATLVLAALHDRHGGRTDAFAMFAGLTAGLAAWTKNEGIMFLAAVVVARLATAVRPMDAGRLGREARAFAIGLLPMLVIIGYFKLRLAPPNDLMSAFGSGEILDRLADPHRYLLVVRAFATGILGFGANGLVSAVWLLVAYGLCVWVQPRPANTRWLRMTGAVIGLMLLGHAAVFVATAEDVARLLNSSLERLLLQLWPATVFASFMLLATPAEAGGLEARPLPGARSDPAG